LGFGLQYGAARNVLSRIVMAVTSYRDLEVWQRAMTLAEACYGLTAELPVEERFTLCVQIRRAAVSIPANLAEGHRRPTRVYINHVSIALGSHAELETYLELTRRLKFLQEARIADAETLLKSVGQLLHGLSRALERL
jgi:four helix bundle protein